VQKRPTNIKLDLQKKLIHTEKDPQNAVTRASTTRQSVPHTWIWKQTCKRDPQILKQSCKRDPKIRKQTCKRDLFILKEIHQMQWPARVRLDSLSHMNTKIDLKKRPTNMKIDLQKRPIQIKRDPQNAVTLACTTRQASARVSRLIVSHVTRINELCHTYEWVMSHVLTSLLKVWHDSFIRVTWLIHMCAMTHPYMWHGIFTCVTRIIHKCDMTQPYMWHDTFIRVTWIIHKCDKTHPYMWHDTFRRVTRIIHKCDTNQPHMWRDIFICVTRFIHTCAWVSYFLCEVTHMNESFMSHIWMPLLTHSCHRYEWGISVTWMRHTC